MVRMTSDLTQVEISDDFSVAEASSKAMTLAESAGFSRTKQYMIATAVSELSRNIYVYALKGCVTLRVFDSGTRKGIEVVAEDHGPGIADIDKAMEDHFSTSGSLGLGLPGAKRLMDEFNIQSEPGKGTKITARKWT